MIWWILGGIYGGSALLSTFSACMEHRKIKRAYEKAGYDIIDKKAFNRNVYLDDDMYEFLMLSIFCPVFNTIVGVLSIPFTFQKIKKEELEKALPVLMSNNAIEKSEELLLLEERAYLKKDRLERARKDFASGKVVDFNQLSKVDKLKILSKEQIDVESNVAIEQDNAYGILTREEKLELLNSIRREVLGGYNSLDNVILSNEVNVKSKKKKR